MLALLAAAAFMGFATGCGDFWQAPNGTSTGTTASTTTLTGSSSATVGTAITLTATVSPSTATGTVTFYNNGTSSLGNATLSDGTATDSVTFTTAGTASVTATYNGSSVYAASTSTALSITVSATTAFVPTTTTLEASDISPSAGDRVALKATVFPADATGRVAFYDATASPLLSAPLGLATVNSGTATLETQFTAPGTHRILAVYGGSARYADSATPRAVDIAINP